MKSEDRHRLETNVMAQHLAVWIEKLRPYAASLAGILLFVFIAMFAWSYMSGSSTAWQSEAWDAYNQAVVSGVPDLQVLRQSAQEHPGTAMQQMADTTWADGQVAIASWQYLSNRPAAMEALSRATSAYQSVLQSSDDERLENRARLGLARIYEMQGDLEKAQEEYAKVTGGWEEYAKRRIAELKEPKSKDTYAWLATAEMPRQAVPMGPGTPGRTPEFSAGDVPLPGTTGASPEAGTKEELSFGNLLQGLDLNLEAADGKARYDADSEVPATETSDAAKTDTAAPESAPTTGDAATEETKE